MDPEVNADALHQMKYADLQKLAKKFGIRANMKAGKLMSALEQHIASKRPKTPTSVKKTPIDSKVNSIRKSHVSSPKLPSSPLVKSGKKSEPRTPSSLARSETKTKPATPLAKSESKIKAATPLSNPGTPLTKSVTNIKAATPLARSASKLSVSSDKGKRRTSDVRRSSIGRDSSRKSTPRRSGVLNRTFELQDSDDALTPGSTKKTASKTKSSVVPSSTTKTLLQSMGDGQSDVEMKQSLLDTLDKAAKEKAATTKRRTRSTGGDEMETSSNIPRFVAFAMKKKQEQQQKNDTNPKRTNTPDWQKIHKQHFSKMASLDEYLAKKRKRTDEVQSSNSSIKRAKLLAEESRKVVSSISKIHTPPSILKGKVSLKPGSCKAKNSLFQTPNVAFNPSVISTKDMDLNFSKAKPTSTTQQGSAAKRKSAGTKFDLSESLSKPLSWKPHKGKLTPAVDDKKTFAPKVFSTQKMNLNFSSCKKTATASATKENVTASRKSVGGKDNKTRKSGVTPFKFTAGNVPMNTSQNTSLANKPKFDLKASLAKPMTWKPKTGKVQSFQVTNLYSQTNVIATKTKASKEVNLKSKEERRKAASLNRGNKRKDAQMARRGVAV